jgi:signal peptidase II
LKILYISAAVVIADQFTKIFIKGISLPLFNISINGIIPGRKYPLLGNYLNLTLVENPGIAFGINPGIQLKAVITLITLLITAVLIIYLYKSRNESLLKKTALALMIGGACGNLIDRIFYGIIYNYSPLLYGSVVDFVNLKISDILFFELMIGSYVFNVADIAVSIGLLIMIFTLRTTAQPEIENLAAENQE